MPKLIEGLIARAQARMPLQFRVLHQQFLLRVIDLEALSIEADIPRFLGQFAGVLMMLSFIHAFAVYLAIVGIPFRLEEYLIKTMQLVVGLIAVISWDAIFPDRRDVMVIAPLPVKARTILFAKLAASLSLVALAMVALNAAPGLVATLILGGLHGYIPGYAQTFAAYFLTMIAASLFLYGGVLTIQGMSALLLPRKMFLRLSAVLQLAGFGVLIAVYFLQPALGTRAELAAPQNHWLVASSPTFWFVALFNQLNGTLPPELGWLAMRAWVAFGAAVVGALVSLLLCYLRTMKKTIEEPDLVPGAGGLHWMPPVGGRLTSAIAAFSLRSLTRSRHHRVAFAFFAAIVFALGFSCLQHELALPAAAPVTMDFIMPTLMMMTISVLALRAVFSLPISLNANWVLRTTQLRPTSRYFDATRVTLVLLGVLPVLAATALLSFRIAPWAPAGKHLALLALFGLLFVEMGLFKFDKVPFTCSYLPGKANVQIIFWGFAFVWIIVGGLCGLYEMKALYDPSRLITEVAVLIVLIVSLNAYNRMRARSAVLYFEETPEEVLTRLNLLYVPPAPATGDRDQGSGVRGDE